MARKRYKTGGDCRKAAAGRGSARSGCQTLELLAVGTAVVDEVVHPYVVGRGG